MDNVGFDPWLTAPLGRGSASKKKSARLAGRDAESGKVHVLIKLHDWSGRAIYLYLLTSPDSDPPEKRMRQIPRPTQAQWEQYKRLGVEIPHPGKMQATDVAGWIEYGRQEARRHGLKVDD